MKITRVYEAAEHPSFLQAVSRPTLVKSPVLALMGELSELVLSASEAKNRKKNFRALRAAFMRSPSVELTDDEEPHMVSNAPIPSEWVSNYQLDVRKGGIRRHQFDALVHFGDGHYTPDHFEMCAAATYGCLIFGTKYWEFKGPAGEKFNLIQNEGHTVYIPPGWVHNVKTLSNGGVIIGETMITPASLNAFVAKASLLVTASEEERHNPESEARILCEWFSIPISQTLEAAGGDWYGGPAMTTLRRHVAQQQGGTQRLDALGRKKRRRLYSSR